MSNLIIFSFNRLYARAVFTGYKRGQRNQYENTALLKIEGCKNKDDGKFYVGKRAVYVYKVRHITWGSLVSQDVLAAIKKTMLILR